MGDNLWWRTSRQDGSPSRPFSANRLPSLREIHAVNVPSAEKRLRELEEVMTRLLDDHSMAKRRIYDLEVERGEGFGCRRAGGSGEGDEATDNSIGSASGVERQEEVVDG